MRANVFRWHGRRYVMEWFEFNTVGCIFCLCCNWRRCFAICSLLIIIDKSPEGSVKSRRVDLIILGVSCWFLNGFNKEGSPRCMLGVCHTSEISSWDPFNCMSSVWCQLELMWWSQRTFKSSVSHPTTYLACSPSLVCANCGFMQTLPHPLSHPKACEYWSFTTALLC